MKGAAVFPGPLRPVWLGLGLGAQAEGGAYQLRAVFTALVWAPPDPEGGGRVEPRENSPGGMILSPDPRCACPQSWPCPQHRARLPHSTVTATLTCPDISRKRV